MGFISNLKSKIFGETTTADNGIPYSSGNIVDTNAALEARAADLLVQTTANFTNPYKGYEYFGMQKYGDFYSNMVRFQSASDPTQSRGIARMISLAFIYTGLAYKKSNDTWYVVNNFTRLDNKGQPIECMGYRLSNMLNATNYVSRMDDQETIGVDDGFIWATRTHLRSGGIEFRPYLRMKAQQLDKLNDIVNYNTKRFKLSIGEKVTKDVIKNVQDGLAAGSLFFIEYSKRGGPDNNVKVQPFLDKMDAGIGSIEEMTNFIDGSEGHGSPMFGIPTNVNFKAERNITSEVDIEQFEVEIFQDIGLQAMLELHTLMLNEQLIRDDTEIIFKGRTGPF